MHEDPEALVERRLLRDPEHARELVLQRARPVGVDVRGRQHDAVAALRQERLERRLVASGDRLRAAPGVALGVEQVVVEHGRGEDLALLGRHRLEDPRVDVAQRLGHALPLGPRDQRRELEQLEIADDRVRDVEVGVEAQLAEPAAGAHRRLEQLVAQQAVGRVQRLGRAEQLLLAVLPRGAERRRGPPRPAARAPGARRGRWRAGKHSTARACARVRPTYSAWRSIARRFSSSSAGSGSCSSASGIGSGAGTPAPACRPTT